MLETVCLRDAELLRGRLDVTAEAQAGDICCRIIVFNSKIIVFHTKLTIFNTKLIVFDAKFIIFT